MALPNEPLAERHVKWNDGSTERDVLVRLWKPVVYDGDYVCDFAVDGLPIPGRGHGSGVDSLQALVNALAGIHHMLAPYRSDISWLGTPGSHGVPMGVQSYTGNADEERRLEELVLSEAARALQDSIAKKKDRLDKFRAKHDPSVSDDLAKVSTGDIIELLRAAAKTERQYREAGNDDVARVFFLKRYDLIDALRDRPEYIETLQALTSDDDRAIRLQSAQHLMPSPQAQLALERLRDDEVEPESSEAKRDLLSHERADARPRPWTT